MGSWVEWLRRIAPALARTGATYLAGAILLAGCTGARLNPVDSQRTLVRHEAVLSSSVLEAAAVQDGIEHGTMTSSEARSRLAAAAARVRDATNSLLSTPLARDHEAAKAALVARLQNMERALEGAMDAAERGDRRLLGQWVLRVRQTAAP